MCITANPETILSGQTAGFGTKNALPTRNHANSPDTGLWEAKGFSGWMVGSPEVIHMSEKSAHRTSGSDLIPGRPTRNLDVARQADVNAQAFGLTAASEPNFTSHCTRGG